MVLQRRRAVRIGGCGNGFGGGPGSGRRFCGLSLAEAAPDETTLVRFRARLREHGLIRAAAMTTAREHDTNGMARVLAQDCPGRVIADKGFDSRRNRDHVKAAGGRDGIMRCGRQGRSPRAPSRWHRRRNRLLAAMRGPVEKIFGHWKRTLGYRRVRYLGLKRNSQELVYKCLAWISAKSHHFIEKSKNLGLARRSARATFNSRDLEREIQTNNRSQPQPSLIIRTEKRDLQRSQILESAEAGCKNRS